MSIDETVIAQGYGMPDLIAAKDAALHARRMMAAYWGFALVLYGALFLLFFASAVVDLLGFNNQVLVGFFSVAILALPIVIFRVVMRRTAAGLRALPQLLPQNANREGLVVAAAGAGIAIGLSLATLDRNNLNIGERIIQFATAGLFFAAGLSYLWWRYRTLGMWEYLVFAAAYVPVTLFLIIGILLRPYYLPLKEMACGVLLLGSLGCLIGGASLHQRWKRWVQTLPQGDMDGATRESAA